MSVVRIGLLGLGTVGQGVAEVLLQNAQEITRRAGREVEISHVCSSNREMFAQLGLNCQLSTDPFAVVNDNDVDIVVEVFGGDEPARELLLRAIENGKHVVTANKGLIAGFGNEIFSAATQQNVMVGFEAAVAGGIPIIKTIREGLAANRIEWLAGIINGTTNFILTEMEEKGAEFSAVLKQAQELGYAEADPTFDVEGVDAAHKLTILASIAFGIPLQFSHVQVEGITGITPADIANADELGYRFKHLGIAKKTAHGIELRVHPTLIPKKRLIANVNGVMNAIVVKGNAVGATLHYGAGAGSLATASSVVADIIDVARGQNVDAVGRVPHLAFQAEQLEDLPIVSAANVQSAYYLRLRARDESGVLAKITTALADHNISIEAFLQKEPATAGDDVDIVLITNVVSKQQVTDSIAELEALSSVPEKVASFHVETFSD